MGLLFHVDLFPQLKIKMSSEDEHAAENCAEAKGNNRAKAEFHQGFLQSEVEDMHTEMI